MARAKRRPVGFNLAFLDIMSCGLGAVILIFMLVKYQTDQPDTESSALQAELADRQNKNSEIESANTALAAQIELLKQELQRQVAQSAKTADKGRDAAAEVINLAKQVARLQQQKAAQTQKSAARPDTPASKKKTQEDHLLGLRVEGARILILLDNSASMADEHLVDIIKIKVADTAAKKAAPKWRWTLAVARWIIERVPDDSEYMVVHYNDKANFLPAKKWLRGDDAVARSTVLGALENLYPHNATNLHSALALIKSGAIRPTDIYVVTDSLPTKGNLSALKRIKKCGTVGGRAATVSGECRLALFFSAVDYFSGAAARVNTVLLPVEGDPDAAHAYWLWAAATTGTMVSPAASWP